MGSFRDGNTGRVGHTARLFAVFLIIAASAWFGCKSPIEPDPPLVASLTITPSSGTAPLEVRIVLDGTPTNIAKYILRISTDENAGSSAVQKNIDVNKIDPRFEERNEREEISGGGESVSLGILESRTGSPLNESSDERVRGGFRDRETGSRVETRERAQDDEGRDPGRGRIIDFGRRPFMGPGIESKESFQPHRVVVLGNDVVIEEIEAVYSINITRVYDNQKEKDVKIYFSGEVIDTKGRHSSIVRSEVVVKPRGDVSIEGILRCNETKSGVRGKIKVFDANKNSLKTDKSDSEGYTLTDSNGKFNFRVKRIASESDEILIRAAHGIPGNRQGWIRTINIPAKDNSGLTIVGVPYGECRTNPDEFRDFMYDISGLTHKGYIGLFDYENFDKGFVIIRENLDDALDGGKPEGKGKFSNEQIEYIKKVITPFVQNVDKAVNKTDYKITVQETSEGYNPGVGIIYIIPSTMPGGNPSYGGLFRPYGTNRFNQGADIYILTRLSMWEGGLQRATLHEIGHLLYGHTTNQNSVMAPPGTNRYSTFDLKGFKIIYEENFRRKNWVYGDETGPLHHLRDILGKSFDTWD